MRIRFTSLIVLLSAVCLLSSCLKDDDDDTDYTYYGDTGLSAFSLGTMKRYLHTKTAAGKDSVYKLTYVGSAYKFTIDQLGHRIYNTDSLPYGTDVKHVIASVTAVNNGIIYLKSATSDSLAFYSNTDSIDFSTPRTLRVVSQDGQRYVDYTVKLNVRTVPAGTISWQKKTDNAQLAQLDKVHALSAGSYVYVFGLLNGQTVGYSSGIYDGETWTPMSGSFSARASFVTKGNALFALDNGTVYSSSDNGQSWTAVATNSALKRLVAASSAHLYALAANGYSSVTGIAESADDGRTWTNDDIDDNAMMLPDDEVSYTAIPVRTNDSIEQVMIVGRCSAANDIYARTWTKLDDYSSQPVASPWTYVDNSGESNYSLGEIPSLTVTAFGGYPVALISNGSYISSLLQSRDSGLTWEASGRTLPDGLSSAIGKLTMTTDSEGSLWIISDGSVWKE